MATRLLDQVEIETGLRETPNWRREGKEIVRELKFADFREAMRFVNAVAEAAEKADHHPDIDIRYNKVSLRLSTHSAGGLTSKDFDLARNIEFCVP